MQSTKRASLNVMHRGSSLIAASLPISLLKGSWVDFLLIPKKWGRPTGKKTDGQRSQVRAFVELLMPGPILKLIRSAAGCLFVADSFAPIIYHHLQQHKLICKVLLLLDGWIMVTHLTGET